MPTGTNQTMNPDLPAISPRNSVNDAATIKTSKRRPVSPPDPLPISSSSILSIHDQIFQIPPPSPISPSPDAFASSPWDIVPSQPYSAASPHRCLATVTKRCGKILSLALSDAGLVYAGTESKAIRVWRHPGFFEISRLRSGSGSVEALLVSSGDGLVFSSHADCKVRVWKSHPIHVRKGTLPSAKDRLIEACRNQPMKVMLKITSSRSYTMLGGANNKLKHSGTITSLAYDHVAKLLYSASSDGTVKVWSVREMKCVETLQAHDGSVNALAIGPEAMLLTGSDDCKVKIWQRITSGERCSHLIVFQMNSQSSPVKSLVLSGGGEGSGGADGEEVEERYVVLYAGCSDGYVRYWKRGDSSGHMVYLGCLRGHSDAVLCLAAVGKVVISGSGDASIRVWRRSGDGLAAHECTAILCSHIGPVKALAAAAADGEEAYVVYSGSLDGSVKQWRVRREASS